MMNAILTMSSFLFPLISYPYVSRILQAEGIGKVSFVTSVLTYFTLFSQLGIPTYGIRACAQVRDDRQKLTQVAQELLVINLIMGVLAYILLALALIFIPRMRTDVGFYVVMSGMILLNAIGMEWLFRALEEYTFITIRSLVFKGISLVAMLLLVKNQNDCLLYGGITLFSSCGSYLLNFVYARRYIDFSVLDQYSFKRHFRPILTFFALSCATTIYTNLDTVMLGFIKNNVDVGFYNTAVKVKNILVSAVTSLGAVLLPRASYYIEHGNHEDFCKLSRNALTFVFLVASPLLVFFMIFAKPSILLLSGEGFAEAIPCMQILMPTLLFIGLTNIMGMQMLVPNGREKMVLWSVVAGAGIDLVINMILIPRMASIGAAIGTLVAEIVVLLIQYIILRSQVREVFLRFSYLRVGTAITAGALASFWTLRTGWSSFAVLSAAACLFFGTYALVLVVIREPSVLELLKQVREVLCRRHTECK